MVRPKYKYEKATQKNGAVKKTIADCIDNYAEWLKDKEYDKKIVHEINNGKDIYYLDGVKRELKSICDNLIGVIESDIGLKKKAYIKAAIENVAECRIIEKKVTEKIPDIISSYIDFFKSKGYGDRLRCTNKNGKYTYYFEDKECDVKTLANTLANEIESEIGLKKISSIKSAIITIAQEKCENIDDKLDTYINYFTGNEKYGKHLSSTKKTMGDKYVIYYKYNDEQATISKNSQLVISAINDIQKDLGLHNKSYVIDALKNVCQNTCEDDIVIKTENEKLYDKINDEDRDDKIKDILQSVNVTYKTDENDWKEYENWLKNDADYADKDRNFLFVGDKNLKGFLNNFPTTKGKIRYNETRDAVEFDGKSVIKAKSMYYDLLKLVQEYAMPRVNKIKDIEQATIGVAFENKYWPFIEYIESLTYDDSRDWIEYLIRDVMIPDDIDEYYDLYYEELKLVLYAKVVRSYKPGTKFDYALYFVSRTNGTGKTTIPEKLFTLNGREYCTKTTASSIDLNNSRFIQACSQSLCVNFDEAKISTKDVPTLKAFISLERDTYHKLYNAENESEGHEREFIIVGTSNNDDLLKDYTNETERRFLIVHLAEDEASGPRVWDAFDEKKCGYRLQDKIWAQVKHMYDNNEIQDLTIPHDSVIWEKLCKMQRNYKASNTSDYAYLFEVIDGEYGFYEYGHIDVDCIVAQVKYKNSREWCNDKNMFINRANEKDHLLRPEEARRIKYFGHIDMISEKDLRDIAKKLGVEYVPQTFQNECRARKIWMYETDKNDYVKPLRNTKWYDGKTVRGFKRIQPYDDCVEFVESTSKNKNEQLEKLPF